MFNEEHKGESQEQSAGQVALSSSSNSRGSVERDGVGSDCTIRMAEASLDDPNAECECLEEKKSSIPKVSRSRNTYLAITI